MQLGNCPYRLKKLLLADFLIKGSLKNKT